MILSLVLKSELLGQEPSKFSECEVLGSFGKFWENGISRKVEICFFLVSFSIDFIKMRAYFQNFGRFAP